MKTIKTVFVFSLLVASFAVLYSAQAPQQRSPGVFARSIHGEVRYSQGGGMAENVLVQLDLRAGGLVAQVSTDHTGKFDFSGLEAAVYRLTASTGGFEPATQDVVLTNRAAEAVILTLVPRIDRTPP